MSGIDNDGSNTSTRRKIMNASIIAVVTATLATALAIANGTSSYYAAAVSPTKSPTPLCPSGTTFNKADARCEASPNCLSNQTSFNSATGKCEADACPSGDIVNSATGECEGGLPPCPFGFFVNSATGECEAAPICPTGTTVNSGTGKCEGSACPTGTTFNSGTGKCEAQPTYTCPPGYVLNTSKDMCKKK
jgi:hypothetical protein